MTTAARRPTMADVARQAGVSTATVSRVINGSDSVDAALRSKVESAIAATGYVPNVVGRSLRRGGSGMIAVVSPDAENPYFTQIISEVERYARSAKRAVTVTHTENDLEVERASFAQLVGRQVTGVVLIPVDAQRTDVSLLQANRVPLVLVDRAVEGVSADLVVTDNRDAGRQAAMHLLDRGFHNPAIIAGPSKLAATEDRLSGFTQACRERGVELSDLHIMRGDLHLESGRTHMENIVQHATADCVYVTNNRMSAGAFEAIRGRAEAPALLATDDDLWTRLVTPSISVVKQPVRATGRAAARMLDQRMRTPNEDPSTTLLRPRLIERESTRPRH